MDDRVRTYPEVIAEMQAEIERLRDDVALYREACVYATLDADAKDTEISRLRAIIDKQCY